MGGPAMSSIPHPTPAGPWIEHAACYGHKDLFFPPTDVREHRYDRNRRIRRAKGICAVCPVKAECLEWAQSNNEQSGIWGGWVFDYSRHGTDLNAI
jgi:WhiB family redox-sensing transcriptional regulator